MLMGRAVKYAIQPGQTHGDWLILSYAPPNRWGRRMVLCRCTRCLTERAVLEYDIARGASTGCGCHKIQKLLQTRHRHAHAPRGAKSKSWIAWRDMKRRYGEERVCREWWTSFEAFVADVGEKPSPNHRLSVQRGRPLLPSTVSWTLKRETTIPRNVARAARRVQQAEARRAA